MSKRIKRILITIVSALVALAGGFYIYTLDYYRADEHAHEVLSANENRIEIRDNMTIFYPEEQTDKNIGFIFYPGGKVEAIAYAPILENISRSGITCVLLEMPFNLAVFDINAADKVYPEFSHIDKWYLMGHSLGGAMASSYAGKNPCKLTGLILLGAYPVNDADVPLLVIYGSEDMGLDITKLHGVENKYEIEDGNHAYFGNYGEQKGDGAAAISRERQQEMAVELIIDFIDVH